MDELGYLAGLNEARYRVHTMADGGGTLGDLFSLSCGARFCTCAKTFLFLLFRLGAVLVEKVEQLRC